jgi:hypothetical protein
VYLFWDSTGKTAVNAVVNVMRRLIGDGPNHTPSISGDDILGKRRSHQQALTGKSYGHGKAERAV